MKKKIWQPKTWQNLAYKRATMAADKLQEQYDKSQDNNVDLLAKLQQTKEELKEAQDRLHA